MNDVEKYIASYQDWRGERLVELRNLINTHDTALKEEIKWSVPVWSQQGLICAISAFKDHVKINFFKGASLVDTHKVFNSGLDSKDHRSINLSQADPVPKEALSDLLRQAITLNTGK